MVWIEQELNGYAYFSKMGYDILIPLVKSTPYDFVIMSENGACKRVNVKVAHVHRSNYRINCAGGNDRKNKRDHLNNQVDIYLVWLPDRKDFIEISGDFFSCFKNSVKDIPVSIINPIDPNY